ncbi:MAG: hypothetical protein IPJ85_18210 [Flavobacteriales bacterium]|nr:hypothetical protein [Flavobacteriales bacterium]
METRWKRILIGVVLAHTLLIAFYTFPHQLVPERLRIIGQFYARPLFHQQWRLFAPDPPLCDCKVEVKVGEEGWRSSSARRWISRPPHGSIDCAPHATPGC